MSNQFYNYLCEKIINFFMMNPLNSGTKYNIQFETDEQVKMLYEELQNNDLAKTFEYRDSHGIVKYTCYYLDFPKIKLIVSATIDNIQPDFLTRLRNIVGVEEGYKDKAILFIHNTTLDSIMGGTESFFKEGMPFNINSIQKDIRKNLVDSNFSEIDKAIIELELERKRDELFGDGASIFEYADLLDINGTCIEKDQYKNFGLFYDSKLKDYEGKDLSKRLKENAFNFSRIDEIHKYGNPETQLEKFLDDKGIDRLKKEDWQETDYKDIDKSINNKKTLKVIEYNLCSEDWDKEEGKSKAKSRIRNIIVFNKYNLEDLDIEFYFDESLRKENIKIVQGNCEAENSGKKLKVKLKYYDGDSNFYKIQYEDKNKKVKFEFKIAAVGFDEKYLESIKTKFSIVVKKKESYIAINSNEDSIVFNEFASQAVEKVIGDNYETVDIGEDEKVTFKVSDTFEYEDDSDLIKFKVNINNSIVPFAIAGTNEKISPIEGNKVWNLKREKKCDFKLIGDNKLQHGTREYFARDEFRKNLQLEKQIIEMQGLSFIETCDGLENIDLEVSERVKEAYINIIDYFSVTRKLPSLAYLNEEIKDLYKKFIKVYIEELESIEEGSYLNKKQKNLFKIGTIKREIEDRELLFTPFHPLNIAYQLHVNEKIKDEELEEDIIKKFTSTYLLPYILNDDDKLYIPMEQLHSPEWKYYVDEKLPRYKSSRDFVSKLVNEKIQEFVDHFKYLFNMGSSAPIRINLINTGDSKEILQGIFKYYVKQLKAKKSVLPMEIFIYSNKNITNAFEEVAFNDDIKDLKENYRLDLNVDNMSEEDVLDLYREKVHFYSKNIKNGIEYGHITFLEMTNDVKTITSKMNDISSGVILDGLISGVPSVFLGDSYRTGFGTKYANTETDLMKVASGLNAVNAASNGEPYENSQCKAISVSNNSRMTLDDIYNASHWVTFIDPKVDLNFFKNDPDAKDLLIIHYSDQYTTAGGYDAITVTRKSKPYEKVIEEFLSKKGVEDVKKHLPSVINMFNAINGDWLLRLLSSKSHMPKEKISILSAVKLALAEFEKDNMIWVPISLEEVLRVSGGAGLKQSEGFLSAKKLGFKGSASDDILLIGIEEKKDKVYVTYYPIEVKIGENSSEVITKAINQAKQTKKIFSKVFEGEEGKPLSAAQRVYRNFLMQLVVISAEKLNLYEVCSEANWNKVIDSDLRRKLLNEEYEISHALEESIGKAGVISFKKDSLSSTVKKEEDITVIEMSEDDGFNFVTKTVSEIREDINAVLIDINVIENPNEDIAQDNNEDYAENEEIQDEGQNIEKDTDEEVESDGVQSEEAEAKDEGSQEVQEVMDKAETEDTTSEVPISEELNDDQILKNEEKENSDKDYSIVIGKGMTAKNTILYDPKRKGNPLSNMNVMITGSSGKGKTQLLKSMIVQQRRKGTNLLVFDFKNDFSDKEFLEMSKMKCINLEFSGLPYNPLIPPVKGDDEYKFMNVGEHILALAGVFKQVYKLGTQQEASLKNAFRKVYKDRGINPRRNEVSEDKLIFPIVDDIADILEEEDEKAYSRLDTLFNYGLFTEKARDVSLVELLNDSYVFNLSSISNDEVKNAIAKIIVVSTHQYLNTLPHSPNDIRNIFVFDEAHRFLGEPSLEKLARECRAYGMAIWLSSQYPGDFPDEIKGCLETKIIHGNGDDEEKIKTIKKLLNYSGDDANISRLGLFQAIFSNTHYNKKFINTLGFPQMLLLDEVKKKGEVHIRDIESVDEVRKEEVINYLIKLNLVRRENDVISIIN